MRIAIKNEKIFYIAERSLIVLLILGLVAWGTTRFMQFSEERKKKAAEERTRAFEELHHQAMKHHRLVETEKSIPLWEEALKVATSWQERVHAQAALAWDNFVTCQPEKKKKGVALMKEMIQNASIPGIARAMILTSLLDMYNATHDDDFMHEVIFADEPYKTFLLEAGGDTHLGARKLYEWSLGLGPTANAHLRIAYWYGEQLLRNKLLNKKLPLEKEKEYSAKLAAHLQEGEALMSRDIELIIKKADSPTRVAALRVIHAMVTGFWALQNSEDKANLAKADALFRVVLNDIDKESQEKPDDLFLRDMVYEVRYDYAGFLVTAYGDSRKDDIRQMALVMGDALRPINGKTPLFTQLLLNEYIKSVRKDGKETHVHFPDYHEILKIAEIVPEFKIVLETLGWKFALAN